jgi:hypothetical protein
MQLQDCKGYKSLLADVMKDVERGEGCFNPSGCDHEYYRTVPQKNETLRKTGMLTATMCVSKCFHKYCDKFRWVIDRAMHYAQKTGIPVDEILNAWEGNRDYWYMNYYQDSNQPKIEDGEVRVVEDREAFLTEVGNAGYRCPLCGGVSSDPQTCNSGKEVEPGKICDWKSYGLLKSGVPVVMKVPFAICQIFKPIAWERDDSKNPQTLTTNP